MTEESPIKINSVVYNYKIRKRNSTVYLNVVEINALKWTEWICMCPYTKLKFKIKDGIVLGSIIPQLPYSYLCHSSAKPQRDIEKNIFNSFEKNCNTCVKLHRLPSKKGEPFKGSCYHKPYYHPFNKGLFFYVYPDDHQNMNCWESRVVVEE